MPARRDVLKMLALGSATIGTVELLSTGEASAATASPPPPSGDTSGGTDTGAIQAQLDAAAAAGGGTVQLASGGVYYVKGLTIDTNVVLDLNAGIVNLANGANKPVVASKNFASLVNGNDTGGPSDFQIRNGCLDGNRSNQSDATQPVVAIYGRRFTLDNLVIRNGIGAGLFTQWSLYSPFLAPNGMESMVTRLYIHDCNGDGFNFQGPHDTFVQTLYIAKCSSTASDVPLRMPDNAGRANGSNFEQFHIYGGNGYNYGLVANSGGVKFSNFIVEGAQVAQVLIQAAQVKMDAFHLYPGNIATSTVKGIQLGDSSHTGVNGVWLRGVMETLGGGALDVTYCGDHNNIDITHYVYVPISNATSSDFGVTGTIRPMNVFHLDIIGPTYTKTSASEHNWHGRTSVRRTSSADTRPMLRLMDENDSTMVQFDDRGRPVWQVGSGHPVVAVASSAGSGAKATVTGSDVSGQVSLTTGTAPAAGVLATVSFGTAWQSLQGNGPRVVLQPANLAAAKLGAVSTEAPRATQFALRSVGAPTASTVYLWDFVALG